MGFEQGPIRPPSEAESLLVRVTRNCPWNRCVFCPVYKGRKFSVRKVDEVLADIDRIADCIEKTKEISWSAGQGGEINDEVVEEVADRFGSEKAMLAALHYLYHGRGYVFLQDSDALVLPTDKILKILKKLRERIPGVRRITCYSRSTTLSRKSVQELKEIREAGLDRVHVGMESGCNEVLKMVRKGATAEIHIKGGRHVVDAGLQLSEYFMPGLGGREFSTRHALDSAKVIEEICPHFTRLRSLGISDRTELATMAGRKEFSPLGDDEIVKEIRLFIENIRDGRTFIVSDHILNLLGNLEGRLPNEKEELLGIIDEYLSLSDEKRAIYRIGRRAGIFNSIMDMKSPQRVYLVEKIRREIENSSMSIDEVCSAMLSRMV